MKFSTARTLAVAAVISTLFMMTVAYYWPIQDPYHPLNSDWNGCTKLTEHAKSVTLVSSYNEPLPGSLSLLAIIGPIANFSKSESSAIRAYTELGGTVLLADDFGSANSLLQELNIDARFAGEPLADLHYYSRTPDFPLVGNFASSPITSNVTTIVLNHPTYIEVGNESTVKVLAQSSPFSFVDLSGTGEPFPNETINSYTVMAVANIGKGMLVMVSDPSLFVNEMITILDNMRLFQNLLGIGGGLLLFDVAHLSKAPLTDLRVSLRQSIQSLGRSIPLFSTTQSVFAVVVAVAVVMGVSVEVIRIFRNRRAKSNNHSIY